jgi:hypothetical protein
MGYFKFTAKFLRNKSAYGYDISGEVYEGSGPIAQQEQAKNINDTAQPQDHHETPKNPNNFVVDSDALNDFPELEGHGSTQKFMPTREK